MLSGIIYGNMPGPQSGLMYIYKTDSLGHFDCWERVPLMEVMDLFPVDSTVTLNIISGLATATPMAFADSILDSSIFTTYDGCTFTTGLPPSIARSRQMKVRPNPNTGRFILEVQDPLMAESYYSVYDALGKLLYQRPLPTGATMEEIDLSRFGRGTYVLRITDPEGQRHERVVLE